MHVIKNEAKLSQEEEEEVKKDELFFQNSFHSNKQFFEEQGKLLQENDKGLFNQGTSLTQMHEEEVQNRKQTNILEEFTNEEPEPVQQGDKYQQHPLTCGKIVIHETKREVTNEEGQKVTQNVQIIREITEIEQANLREEIVTTIVQSKGEAAIGRVSSNTNRFSIGKVYEEQKEALINKISEATRYKNDSQIIRRVTLSTLQNYY